MAHLIVIGAGIGGVPAAYELRKRLGKKHPVTLIGASPYFEFTASNPWVAVGWRQCEQTRVALQEPLQATGVQWIPERVDRIDADARRLQLSSGRELDYDYRRTKRSEIAGRRKSSACRESCTVASSAPTRRYWML